MGDAASLLCVNSTFKRLAGAQAVVAVSLDYLVRWKTLPYNQKDWWNLERDGSPGCFPHQDDDRAIPKAIATTQ